MLFNKEIFLQEQYPLQRLGTASGIYGTIASGTPQSPQQPIMTSPGLAASQTLANLYGMFNPRPTAAYGGLMSLMGR